MRAKYQCLCVIAMMLLQSCAVHEYRLKHGIESFQVQDYRSAFIRLLPEAKEGQADAQYAIGYMYYYGQGVVEDRKKARYWIERAASSGQADAQRAVTILKQGKPI